MHVLVLIVFGSVLATTANAIFYPIGANTDPGGCSGQATVYPDFRRGDIE